MGGRTPILWEGAYTRQGYMMVTVQSHHHHFGYSWYYYDRRRDSNYVSVGIAATGLDVIYI